MIKTFNINNVDIKVDYNEDLWTEKEVQRFLQKGAKSWEAFDKWTTEIKVLNYREATNKLFNK